MTPLKTTYILSRRQSAMHQQQQSLVVPCSWSFSPKLIAPILELKSSDGRWVSVVNHTDHHHHNHIVKAWEDSSGRKHHHGLELISFPGNESSSFGIYRCSCQMICGPRNSANYNIDIAIIIPYLFGLPFVIAFEGNLISTQKAI